MTEERQDVEFPEEGNQPQEEEQELEGIEEEELPEEEEAGEEVEAEVEEEPEEKQEKVKIKWNGQELELTEEEVRELAQKGFDYTQKTQMLAEEKKAISTLLDKALSDEEVAGKLLSDNDLLSAIEKVPELKEKLENVRANLILNREPPDPILEPEEYEKYVKEKARIELEQEIKQKQEQQRLLEVQQKFAKIESELQSDEKLLKAFESKLNSMPDSHPVKLGLQYAFQTGNEEAIENFVNEIKQELNKSARRVSKAPPPVEGVEGAGQSVGSNTLDEFYKFMLE